MSIPKPIIDLIIKLLITYGLPALANIPWLKKLIAWLPAEVLAIIEKLIEDLTKSKDKMSDRKEAAIKECVGVGCKSKIKR